MADNVTLPGTGEVVAADDVSTVKYQYVKLDAGGNGASSPVSDGGTVLLPTGGLTEIVSGTLTRPPNTTAYTAEDEVATNSTSPLSLNLARSNGLSGYIVGATLIYSNNPSTTPQFRLLVFDQTVTLAGDNAALALSDADAAKAIGFIDFFATQAGAAGTSGALILKGSLPEPIPFKAAGGSQAIFFALVTKNGFTPIANSETIEVRIGVARN